MTVRTAAPGAVQAALDAAEPGDTVELTAGVHLERVVVRRGGIPGRPITITCGPGAVIRGDMAPMEGHRTLGLDEGMFGERDNTRAAFRLERVSWITFEGLVAEQVWPCVIYARNCRNLTLARSRFWGSTFVLLVRDDVRRAPRSGDIAIVANRWTQDDRMWAEYDWGDAHHRSRRFLNGAFLGTVNVHGPITVRDNDFRHAFNVLRFNITGDIDGQPLSADARACNRDILIENNRFEFIRDNPVEPENHARNLWIVGNQIRNCHSWFSFDGVGGGNWYVFGNRGWFDSVPRADQGHTIGRVFKFDSHFQRDTDRIFVFHNSWFLRAPVAGIGGDSWSEIRDFDFRNNAIEFCAPGRDAMCRPVPFFSNFTWHETVRFDHDLCNHPDFPELIPGWRQEANGVRASGPIFRAPRRGDLRLARGAGGQGRAGALAVTLPDGGIWRRPAGADIGAFQGEAMIEGPAFMAYSGA